MRARSALETCRTAPALPSHFHHLVLHKSATTSLDETSCTHAPHDVWPVTNQTPGHLSYTLHPKIALLSCSTPDMILNKHYKMSLNLLENARGDVADAQNMNMSCQPASIGKHPVGVYASD
jgi:hypothetical protein